MRKQVTSRVSLSFSSTIVSVSQKMLMVLFPLSPSPSVLCSGLPLLAGTLLIHSPAEESFWSLVALLNRSRGYYSSQTKDNLEVDGVALEWLLEGIDRPLAKRIFVRAPIFLTWLPPSLCFHLSFALNRFIPHILLLNHLDMLSPLSYVSCP